MATDARRADWIACAERTAAAGRRSEKLEDGRVASALEMGSEVQERPGGELKLGLAEASAEDQRASLLVPGCLSGRAHVAIPEQRRQQLAEGAAGSFY